MKKRLVVLIGGFFSPYFARKKFQFLFKFFYYLALKGMNYTPGNSFKESGEVNVLHWFKKTMNVEHRKVIIFDVGANIGSYTKLLIEQLADLHFMMFLNLSQVDVKLRYWHES